MPNVKEVALSLADLVLDYALPGTGNIIKVALPPIADAIFGADELAAAVATEKFCRVLDTEVGTFEVAITRTTHPQVFNALRRAQAQSESPAAYNHLSNFRAEASSYDDRVEGGGVSILNGIIGVQW
ncbi:MAG: hypothetical protein AAF533_04365 [Acidobacteriota bacterium]